MFGACRPLRRPGTAALRTCVCCKRLLASLSRDIGVSAALWLDRDAGEDPTLLGPGVLAMAAAAAPRSSAARATGDVDALLCSASAFRFGYRSWRTMLRRTVQHSAPAARVAHILSCGWITRTMHNEPHLAVEARTRGVNRLEKLLDRLLAVLCCAVSGASCALSPRGTDAARVRSADVSALLCRKTDSGCGACGIGPGAGLLAGLPAVGRSTSAWKLTRDSVPLSPDSRSRLKPLGVRTSCSS